MYPFRCIIAHTEQQIMDCQRVRWRVYGEEERLLPAFIGKDGREIDARDASLGTTHFVVYAGQAPVGTVRLLERSDRLGLDLESKLDLGALSGPGIVPAEVTRYCVLREYRRTGVAKALFGSMLAESARRGVTHWVAGANTETDFAEDAELAYRLAQARKLMTPRFRAEPRVHELPRTPRRRPCYTEDQRQRARSGDVAGIDLPRTLTVFADGLGARYMGRPVYDAYFNVFALPLVVSLAEITTQAAIAA